MIVTWFGSSCGTGTKTQSPRNAATGSWGIRPTLNWAILAESNDVRVPLPLASAARRWIYVRLINPTTYWALSEASNGSIAPP